MASRITIDPDAVARNWQTLARHGAAAECGAVVKANAYGCGIDTVTPALWATGCRTYFVATQAEGRALRARLPQAVIYVLNGVFGDPKPIMDLRLRPFLSSVEALREWPPHAPFALNVDTGMNRLGVTVQQALELAGTGLAPQLIASHFACADTPEHPLNAVQEAAFAEVRRAFPTARASFANSAAVLTRPATHLNLTRPGIALYGAVAVLGTAPLETAVRVEGRVIQVREAGVGASIGYGAAEHLVRPSRIAIVSLGYADGFLRSAGSAGGLGGAMVAVNGQPVRLMGRVSMDVLAIDVTDAPCARGDWVEVFGPHVPVDEVANAAGTIGYEFLTGLSRRAERHIGPLS